MTRPLRFTWRTDDEGRFSMISPELALAVGSRAADIVGKPFAEVAAEFGFDADGEIAGLLERRETWSGRTVLWPVPESDLKVPVDLAALPIYKRDRRFEGFRGFGVARGGDAVSVPAAAPEPRDEAPAPPAPPADTPTADPFKGEVPVLSIVPKTERRFSDKIIRLAEHRGHAAEKALTAVERSAFREIGDRLKGDSQAPDADVGVPSSTPEETASEAEAVPAASADTVAIRPRRRRRTAGYAGRARAERNGWYAGAHGTAGRRRAPSAGAGDRRGGSRSAGPGAGRVPALGIPARRSPGAARHLAARPVADRHPGPFG